MFRFQRAQVATLKHRLAEEPRLILAVFGARQTGKSTIVQQTLEQIDLESRYLAVDAPELPSRSIQLSAAETFFPSSQVRDTDWIIKHWEEARSEAWRSERGFVLVFDEIQKIPRWSDTIKGLWDADRHINCPLHVVILGSAPLLMQSGLNESLAGRFELICVTHWSFSEMSAAFGLDLPEYLYFGGYPGAVPYIRDEERWRNYLLNTIIEPNIERDILAMTRVDKPALLKRLFELGARYSGQILSYNKMMGQLHDAGNTTTLARYLDLLSKAGLITGLQKYSVNHLNKGTSPKFNVLNTALMTADSGYSFDEAMTDRSFRGRIVESMVGAHLFNTADSDIRLYYWRDNSLEVDFVLQRGARLAAIEVKSGEKPGAKRMYLPGMDMFTQRYKPHCSLLVGEGGMPLEEFLSVPAGYWFEEDNGLHTGTVHKRARKDLYGAQRPSDDDHIQIKAQQYLTDRNQQKERMLQQEQQWLDHIRMNEQALRENHATPALLHEMAKIYFRQFYAGSSHLDGPNAIRNRLGGDEALTSAVLSGFRGTIDRQDVPEYADILSIRKLNQLHYLGLPYLAGLAEVARTAPEDASLWDQDRKRTSIAFYYTTPHGEYLPVWYKQLLEQCPETVAEVQVKFAVAELRSNRVGIYKLWELSHDKHYSRVANYASLPLLRAFPTRCGKLDELKHLLWAAIQHADRASLQTLIGKKYSNSSLTVAQRVYWLASGFIVSPDIYNDQLNKFVCNDERRIRHLSAFLCNDVTMQLHPTVEKLDSSSIQLILCLIESYVEPARLSFDNPHELDKMLSPPTC